MKTTLLLTGSKHIFIVLMAIFEAILIGLSLVISIEQFSNTPTEVKIERRSPYIYTYDFRADTFLVQK